MLAVAIPFHTADAQLALELVRWIGKLGSVKEFDCVLVCDAGCPIDIAIAVKEEAEKVFKSAPLVTNATSVSGWIAGANSLWYRALDWASSPMRNRPPEDGRSMLFLEPDAVPLRPGWLQELDAVYSACGKAHMGHITETNNAMLPPKCMSGVAVYGPEAARFPRPPQKQPFNVFYADLLLQNAADTPLIKDFFGTKELPPFFLDDDIPNRPSNAFPISWIPDKAVLFHRDKTHSLIPLLAKKLGIEWVEAKPPAVKSRLAVVFNVHRGDIHLATRHALWLRKMNQRWPHRAVIAFDPTLGGGLASQLHSLLAACFEAVEIFNYPTPPVPSYPASANWAWQSCAHHMAQGTSPWLWMEADAIALTPDWLDKLQAEYDACGCSWLGNIVPHLGHLQGTAIFPADAAHRMPGAMSCGAANAFDMQTKEVLHDCHDSRLMHHCWSLLNRMSHPVGGGELPVNITPDELRRWLPRDSVFLHRIKDDSVLNALLTGAYQHG